MKNHLQKAIILSVIVLLAGKAYAQPSISYGTSTQTFTVGDALQPPFALTTTGTTNAGQTTTLAGSGTAGFVNAVGTGASFNNPLGMAVDASGNIYVADAGNNVIRKITPTGAVTTYAGSGVKGALNGASGSSTFNKPAGLAFDAQGNLYVADQGNNMIRMITPSGTVSTLAGSTKAGFADGTGAAAQFNSPAGVLADPSGNIYVADFGNNKIRLISAGGVVTSFAGGGKPGFFNGQGINTAFNGPYSLAMDKTGNLYVGDKQNYMVRLITPAGYVSTFAGNGTEGHNDGSASVATLTFPLGLGFDAAGNLYVADSFDSRIRKITPGGRVSTLSGGTPGTPGSPTGDANGAGNVATFDDPKGLAVDQSGNIYVGDSGNNLVREVLSVPYTISAPLPSGLTFDPNTGNISGTPVIAATPPAYTITAYSYSGPATTSLTLTVVNPVTLHPSTDQNFIITYTPRVAGILTNKALTAASIHKSRVETNIEYFDGLGRPMQTVQVKGSPTGSRDMVQPVAYDQFGREAMKYLPYTVLPTAASDGSYKTTAITDQASFYATPAGTPWKAPGVVSTPFPVMQTVYEPSPLNRVTEQGFAGDNWQPLGTIGATKPGHTVKKAYGTNDDNSDYGIVALYTTVINPDQSETLVNAIDPSTGDMATYNPRQLYLTTTTDENYNIANGQVGMVGEYKDKEGRIVCKRVGSPPTAGPKGVKTNAVINGGLPQTLSTYYVYDDLGHLAFVLPPLMYPDYTAPFNQQTLDNLAYQYRYDYRGRLSQKKLPGKGWEYLVYNNLDQVVATQDGNQRSGNQWAFTKYDALGRVVMTGIWADTLPDPGQAALQTAVNTNTVLWESIALQQTGSFYNYTNSAWPAIAQGQEILTVNYYDTYTNIPGVPAAYSAPAGASTKTTGLLTASLTEVLGMGDMLMKVLYYDDYGRQTQSYVQHYLDITVDPANYDAISTSYDFTNEVTGTTRNHYNYINGLSAPVVTITNNYVYDHMGRKLQTWEQITGSTAASGSLLLSQTDYNQLGQVTTKHQHSTDGANFYQDINYTYNERGWLLKNTAQLFEEKLQYNNVPAVAHPVPGYSPTAQYNGNIAIQNWGTQAAPDANSFIYNYDYLNRLTSGATADDLYSEECEYDLGGNINYLSRIYNGANIDELGYNYFFLDNSNNPYSTNQIQQITDYSNNNAGLPYNTINYAYDANGNMTLNGGLKYSINYNLLNLPNSVVPVLGVFNSPNTYSSYYYDADGSKLGLTVSQSSGSGTLVPVKETYYINGIQYDNNTGSNQSGITFIQTEEGRAIPNGTTYDFEYNLADHLGNTRLTFDTQSGLANTVQQDNYMPFGMDISVGTVGSPKNEYLYNKKEFQEQLQQYDYGARFYDPVIGQWTTVDPKAELSRRFSPYTYVENNPIRNIDPDGMETQGPPGCCDFAKMIKTAYNNAVTATKQFVSEHTFSVEGKISIGAQVGVETPVASIDFSPLSVNLVTSKAELKAGDYKSEAKVGSFQDKDGKWTNTHNVAMENKIGGNLGPFKAEAGAVSNMAAKNGEISPDQTMVYTKAGGSSPGGMVSGTTLNTYKNQNSTPVTSSTAAEVTVGFKFVLGVELIFKKQ